MGNQCYAHIVRTLGLPASTVEEGVESFVQAIISLGKELNIHMNIAGQGIKQETFESVVDVLSESAFEDQCKTTNPKLRIKRSI